MTENTFPGLDAPAKSDPMSYGRRVTKAKNDALARGLNPGSGRELRTEGNFTCGQCWHAIDKSGRGFWKCELGRLSNSSTTDIRLSWPACVAYSSKDDGKGIAPDWVTRRGTR